MSITNCIDVLMLRVALSMSIVNYINMLMLRVTLLRHGPRVHYVYPKCVVHVDKTNKNISFLYSNKQFTLERFIDRTHTIFWRVYLLGLLPDIHWK